MEKWNEKIDKMFHFIMLIICIVLFMTAIYAGFQNLETHLQQINYCDAINGGL